MRQSEFFVYSYFVEKFFRNFWNTINSRYITTFLRTFTHIGDYHWTRQTEDRCSIISPSYNTRYTVMRCITTRWILYTSYSLRIGIRYASIFFTRWIYALYSPRVVLPRSILPTEQVSRHRRRFTKVAVTLLKKTFWSTQYIADSKNCPLLWVHSNITRLL